MIKEIKMHLPSYEVTLLQKGAIINDKEIVFTKDEFNDIVRIIRLWNNTYYSLSAVDMEKYYIIVKTDKDESLIEFIGTFPDDFFCLVNYLGDLYARK